METKTRKQVISDIAGLATAVYDNGRRGQPRPGCDCVQCFGYCMVDGDQAARDSLGHGARHPVRPDGSLDFDS